MSYDPRIICKGSRKDAPVFDKHGPDLKAIAEGLASRFPSWDLPKIEWTRRPAKIKHRSKVELVKLKADGTVVVHSLLSHPRLPSDVLEVVVFVGLLMSYGIAEQKEKRSKHPFDHERMRDWIEGNVRLLSAHEFYATFVDRFDRWHQSL